MAFWKYIHIISLDRKSVFEVALLFELVFVTPEQPLVGGIERALQEQGGRVFLIPHLYVVRAALQELAIYHFAFWMLNVSGKVKRHL